MREMVLNHASMPPSDAPDLPGWLSDLAGGVAVLVTAEVTERALRMSGQGVNAWFVACQTLRQKDRDSHVFLSRLAAKVPVTDGVRPATVDRLLSCESLRLSSEDGEPLLLCAIEDWIAVGCPSAAEWDRSRLRVDFRELLPDGTFEEADEVVDNLTRSSHADAIAERHRESRRASSSPESLWSEREKLFPSLLFGPEVEGHLQSHSALLPKIVRKLVSLDAASREWTGGPAPTWKTKVTPEADNVMEYPILRDARVFRSVLGGHELFEWHARVGGGFRIHLRFEAADRIVEIGYVGPKLPT